jgi:hypothetical protein
MCLDQRCDRLARTSVGAVQVTVLSAPVSVYSLQNKEGWLHLFSDLFFLCTAAMHVCLCIPPAVRYLRLAAWGMQVRLLTLA